MKGNMRRSIRLALASVLFLLLMPASRAQAANLFTVMNTKDAGAGSLRQAMLDAISADAGPALIEFNIPKSDPGYGLNTPGVWTIRPLSALPSLTVGAIVMDGNTQRVHQGMTNGAKPNVEIDGANACCMPAILSIESGVNTIQWLVINRGVNDGVQIVGSPSFRPFGNYIQFNDIGTDASGTNARPNNTGIELLNGPYGNHILNNVIAGNTLDAVEITGSGTDDNEIHGNVIGAPDAPNGRHGVFIRAGAESNTVDQNQIVASGMNGVYILSAPKTTISNNSIGACSTSSPGGGCADANAWNGIALEGGASSTQVSNNSIWWNKQHGIWMSDSGTSAAVTGNYIGTSSLHGIAVYNGAESSMSNNEIWYSGWSGVAIVHSDHNIVQDNDIGAYRIVPDDPRGSGYYGVAVVGGSDNTIGPGNVIAHNGLSTASDGVRIDGATALHNRITQNSIFHNGGKGIALVNGGNAPASAPFLSQANCQGIVGGAILNSIIEVFSDASDEGRYYEGVSPPTSMSPFGWKGTFRGPKVTVTATDSTGNTSEFSKPFAGACFKVSLPLIRR